jgi:transcriptional regulator with XRE-family HTH domain
MEDKKMFGEYVLRRRKEIGLTQKEFASKLFVTESAVSKWERGLSYPDITLIRDICEILQISEHELLTGSEDVKARHSEKLAVKYTRMIMTYRNVLSVVYGLSLIICFVCNIAIQQKLSWFFIVLTSEMIAISLTLLPIYVSRRKGLITLGAFVGSVSLLLLTCNIYAGGNWFLLAFTAVIFGMSLLFLPFILSDIILPEPYNNHKALIYFTVESLLLFLLLIVCNLYTGGDWFTKIALPITLFSLSVPWGIMLIIRYLKVNGYFKAAACFALGIAFEYLNQGVFGLILKDGKDFGLQFNLLYWNQHTVNGNISIIILMILFILTLLFCCMGILAQLKPEKN